MRGPAMTPNVIGEPISHPPKGGPAKSDRRSNKPIMEKRRRARINNCLNELKTLILDATKKDAARHSKLEKADILEKTVKYIQELQRQQAVLQEITNPNIINKFKDGFSDCIREVNDFAGLDLSFKRRLIQHLQNRLNSFKMELHQRQRQSNGSSPPTQQLQAQFLPSPPSSPEQHDHIQRRQYVINPHVQQTQNGYFMSNRSQMIPTKLSNGTIAFMLPQNPCHGHHQQPMAVNGAQHPNILVTVPTRTSSTASASSNSSCEQVYSSHPHIMRHTPPSPTNSHEAVDYKPSDIHHASASQDSTTNQQPLALVTKKHIKEEAQPWRPW